MRVITEFQGPFRWLSNFWPCSVQLQMLLYPSAEHAYQAMKFLDTNTRIAMAAEPSPGAAKRLGQKAGLRPGWESMKNEVMLEVVRAKFTQNFDLRKQLIDTEDWILQEGNRWGDRYWGICPPGSTNGQNNLGIILMQVRKELL